MRYQAIASPQSRGLNHLPNWFRDEKTMNFGVIRKFDSIVAHRNSFYVSSGDPSGFRASAMLDNLHE
ncbi:hypothetical protein H6F95_30830 [Cyanobacteria bacterium FACHB-471]|nr:hypothetical protein [Cyanobacteria bacterium FACHB-471]